MKKNVVIGRCLVLLCLLLNFNVWAAQPYAVKAMFYGGKLIPISRNLKNIQPGPLLGGEVDFELLPCGRHTWEQFWGFPTLGIGLVMLDLGTSAKPSGYRVLGQSMACYPYVLVPIVRGNVFHLYYKVGTGLSFFNKRWNTCDTLHGVAVATANAAIGSVVNCYISTGMNMNFNILAGLDVEVEAGYNHMSNGSVLQPNGGLNILYTEVGLRYDFSRHQTPWPPAQISRLTYDFALNIAVCGGVRELYYRDNKRYAVGSLHVGATRVLANFYALGGGIDAFYDGVFVQQGTRGVESYKQHTYFNRYFINNEDLANKFRVGVCISNEFIMGRVTALLDWGIYVWDPLRNASPEPHPKYGYKRPLVYGYNINKEDGWNYFRIGLRCRVWDNLFLHVAMKAHLQKAEMLELGVGYHLPFTHENLGTAPHVSGYKLLHPDRKRF